MHDAIRVTIDTAFLRVCTPQQAYDWLAARPREGFTRNRFSFLDRRKEEENTLLSRADPLIDHALARFGTDGEVAATLYGRLDAEGRKVMRACHRATGGPVDAFNGQDPNSVAVLQEMSHWVTNPDLGDDLLTALFEKTGPFEGVEEDGHQALLSWAAENPRLASRYDETTLDGYDQYQWGRPVKSAWALAATVPLTQPWASALWGLLGRLVDGPSGDFDIDAAIRRWRIDERPVTTDKWFDNSPSFYLRTVLAKLKTQDVKRRDDPDLAVRAAWYEQFYPSTIPDWPSFVEADGAVFFHAALQNPGMWSSHEQRARLRKLAWDMPDPRSNMDDINDYLSQEARMRHLHPEWFVERDDEPAAVPSPERPEPRSQPERKQSRFFRFGQ